ncbi:MAG: DEAD/DEAH box helicase family protein, partial [Pseudomonadota bacterium]
MTEDVTVVMPTGTGKTETMMASICAFPIRRPLILVPSVSLREQTTEKFRSLGILRELGAIRKSTQNPVVTVLEGGIRNDSEYELISLSNVVISTPQSINNCDLAYRTKLFADCTHLFVDEAHHVRARTWDAIKKEFEGRPVVQFTATPFRYDRKKVGGRIIYNYPMSLAQESGVFRKIRFESVYEISDERGDREIARIAVETLRKDLDEGFDHILMARCGSKKRADAIFKLYEDRYSDLNPVCIYSGIPGRSKKDEAIRNKQHRIVVCVNMLGEGFDLPELKVCALHDIHKSLPI